MNETWKLFVDTGGTFTDALARIPSGELLRTRVLSSGALRGRRTLAPARLIVRDLLLGLTVALFSCGSPVGVERAGFDAVYAQTDGDVLSTGTPSSFSIDVLRRSGLQTRFENDPTAVLERLHDLAVSGRDRDVVCALAELSYAAGVDADDGRPFFLSSACYAWIYLFDAPRGSRPDAFDPRVQLACEVYGRAVARAFLDDDGDAFVSAGGSRLLVHGELDVDVDTSALPYDVKTFDAYLPSAEYEIWGVANRHHRAGLGATLIGTRTDTGEEKTIRERLSEPKTAAVTALLRLEGGLAELDSGRLRARLELLDALEAAEVDVGGVTVPLETDVSAALAFALKRSKLFDLELSSFFGGEDIEDYSGLYVLRTYDPAKIPVVFIHGTSSSLARWADMFNDLTADDTLRERYQFWFFTYLSGRPVPLSSNVLRDSLRDARQRLDPEGDDPAFDQMVLVGHSQGGLLARQMVVDDPEETVWDALFTKPIEKLEGEPESLEMLREAFLSPPVPFVHRVIYIATPHRGSFQADRWLGRLVRSFITLPRRALTLTTDLITLNRDALRYRVDSDVPTSLDSMRTTNPFMLALAELPAAPGVYQHSIIAIDGPEEPPEGDDGVVEYISASIDGIDSEFLVRSFHSCQANPLTIAEVRRILYEGLAEYDGSR